MPKSLGTLVILALVGASAAALPSISGVEAGETAALAKGDRLDIRNDCSQQVGRISHLIVCVVTEPIGSALGRGNPPLIATDVSRIAQCLLY